MSWAAQIERAFDSSKAHAAALLVRSAAPFAAMRGRLDLIGHWIERLPPQVVQRDARLIYWWGVSLTLVKPADAYPLLAEAHRRLVDSDDVQWRLMSWAGLLDGIFAMYQDLSQLDPLIDWMDRQPDRDVDALPRPIKSLVVGSMMLALGFRQPAHPRIERWRDRCERLAELSPRSDLGLRLGSALVSDALWRGHLADAELIWQRANIAAQRSPLSPLASILHTLNEATIALHRGDAVACADAVERGLALSADHGCRIWDSVLLCHAAMAALSRQDFERASTALKRIDDCVREGILIDEAYFRATVFWMAYVRGDRVGLLSRCEAALRSTDSKGVPYLQAAIRFAAALAMVELGDLTRSDALLSEGSSMARAQGNRSLQTMGCFIGSYLAFHRGDTRGGETALRHAMREGSAHGIQSFFFWPQAVFRDLLDRAFTLNIETQYGALLAKAHGIVPASNVPSLSDKWAFSVRLYTLGGPVRVELANGECTTFSGQSNRQIELLTLLIARQGRPVPVQAVAQELYGDAEVDPVASLKRVLHSLRTRLGPAIRQEDGSLRLDFQILWVDACALQRVAESPAANASVTREWIATNVKGLFMEGFEQVGAVRRHRARVAERLSTLAALVPGKD